jgi:hypothetical protein
MQDTTIVAHTTEVGAHGGTDVAPEDGEPNEEEDGDGEDTHEEDEE